MNSSHTSTRRQALQTLAALGTATGWTALARAQGSATKPQVLRLGYQKSSTLAVVLNRHGEVIFANAALENTLGMSRRMLDGSRFSTFIAQPALLDNALAPSRRYLTAPEGRRAIILLAPEERARIARYRRAGFEGYLIKPLDRERLEEALSGIARKPPVTV